MALKKDSIASSPPADAPIPTMWLGKLSATGSLLSFLDFFLAIYENYSTQVIRAQELVLI
jgi:hypothetical protein